MERPISVGIRPKYVDHLQRWSRIFRSEETEMNLSIWIPTEISGIFGIMESTRCMPVSVAWSDEENFYSPLDGLLVHCRVTITIL